MMLRSHQVTASGPPPPVDHRQATRGYPAAHRTVMPSVIHSTQQYANRKLPRSPDTQW